MKSWLTIWLLSTPLWAWSQTEDLRFQIERIILNDTEISLDDTPGFLVGIVDGANTYYVDFGAKDLNREEKLVPTDIFELGSVSKVFTSSLLSVLVHDGLLSYQDKVNDLLPDEYQNPRLQELRIIDLVQHYSTLPIRPYYFGRKNIDPDNPYKYYTKDDLLKFYTEYVPENRDGFHYAHTNYALLEILLERATGKEYGQLLTEYLFSGLDMQSSFVDFKEEIDSVLTPGYDRASRLAEPWQFSSFAASEGVKSTAADLVKFMRANMGISNTRLDKIFEPNITADRPTDFNEQIYTGKGWQIISQRKKYDIVTHTGKTGGYSALLAFVKETKTGVVILSNSNIGTNNLGFLILRMINDNWKRKTP